MSHPPRRLEPAQVDGFWRDGYLVVDAGFDPAELRALRERLGQWVQASRAHPGSFGETVDGRPRFDVAESHRAERPALRRVDNPSDVDDGYARAAFDSPMTDMVADLVGPDVRFHHSKINLKQPGTETRVDWHQDFSYTPHTNDDVVTALLMLDDTDAENGCLMVVPGSHREGQKSLWLGERFTGKTDAAVTREARTRAVPVTGGAGSVCFMHTLLLHGSEPNRSSVARALFIAVYAAADAIPLAASPLPNQNQGRVVRGRPSRHARLNAGLVELPESYRAASFFEVQERSTPRS